MFRFPFFGYPYNYHYYNYYNNYQNSKKVSNQTEKNSITKDLDLSNTINSNKSKDNEQAIFSILGINLYLDDLIILGILYFLYQQKVKDEMLYIILFLLLFS